MSVALLADTRVTLAISLRRLFSRKNSFLSLEPSDL